MASAIDLSPELIGGSRPLAPAETRTGRFSAACLQGRYRLGELIARGGMGEIYRAQQLCLGRSVAIKILSRQAADAPEIAKRFQREARALSLLKHRGVAGIIELGEHESLPYIAMELIEGRTLEAVLLERTRLPIEEATPILLELLEVLEEVHRAGVIHRDLKPSNILLDREGRPHLIDFGAARMFATELEVPLTRAGQALGTPRYVSPEQALGLPIDAATDLYSLGVIAFRMLSGKLPLDPQSPAEAIALHASVRVEPLLKAADLPRSAGRIAGVIDRLLSKAPGDRFGTAAKAADALNLAAVELGPTEKCPKPLLDTAVDLPAEALEMPPFQHAALASIEDKLEAPTLEQHPPRRRRAPDASLIDGSKALEPLTAELVLQPGLVALRRLGAFLQRLLRDRGPSEAWLARPRALLARLSRSERRGVLIGSGVAAVALLLILLAGSQDPVGTVDPVRPPESAPSVQAEPSSDSAGEIADARLGKGHPVVRAPSKKPVLRHTGVKPSSLKR